MYWLEQQQIILVHMNIHFNHYIYTCPIRKTTEDIPHKTLTSGVDPPIWDTIVGGPTCAWFISMNPNMKALQASR